jgi:MFS family permease
MLGALLGANALSMTGNVMAMIAVPWFVLETTGSAYKTGITGFVTFLPVVVAGAFGGTLVDAIGHRRSSIVADLASGGTIALVPILYAAGALSFPLLLALVFAGALLDAPGTTARTSLVPEAAGRAGVGIERASALADGVNRLSSLIGGPLAGLLIAAFGTQNVLFFDAGTFVVSATLVAVYARRPQTHVPAEKSSYRENLADGWQFVRRDPILMAIVPTFVITNFLDAAFGHTILPAYGLRVLGSAAAAGAVVGALGAGALLGSLAYGWRGDRLPRRPLLAWGMALAGVRFLAVAAGAGTVPLTGVALIGGLGVGPVNPIGDVVVYERTPPHMRGRVFGLIVATVYGAMPLGALAGGAAVDAWGLSATSLVGGLLYLGAPLLLLRASFDAQERLCS